MPLHHSFALPFFEKYHAKLKVSGVLQVFIFLLGAIVLDEGEVSRFTLLCAAAYWCGVGIIMVRRNGHATRLDRFLMAWGYPLVMPLVLAVGSVVPVGVLRHA